MRINIFFYKDDTRYSVNQIKAMGITDEEEAIKYGYQPVINTKPYFDRYTEKQRDLGVVYDSNTKTYKLLWEKQPLDPGGLMHGLRELKKDRILELKERTTALFKQGLVSDALGVAHRYDTDKDRDMVNLLIDYLSKEPALISCTELSTGVKKLKEHTVEQVEIIYKELMELKKLRTEFWRKETLIKEAPTAEEVRKII